MAILTELLGELNVIMYQMPPLKQTGAKRRERVVKKCLDYRKKSKQYS